MGRLVEAELYFELLDEFGVEALGAAIFRRGGVDRGATLRAAPAEIAALAGAGDTGARAGIGARKLSITRSTGPPGANCTTTNETSMMPSKVGIMNSRRRTM